MSSNSKIDVTMTATNSSNNNNSNSHLKVEQHSKPILSPTRSLDEGFERAPQIIRRQQNIMSVQQQQLQLLDKFYKDRRISNDGKFLIQMNDNSNSSSNNNNNNNNNNNAVSMQNSTRATLCAANTVSTLTAGTTTSSSNAGNGSPSATVQRLQYQKQRQPMVASAAGHQSVHNHRFTPGGSGNSNSGFRRARTRASSPSMLKTTSTLANVASSAVTTGCRNGMMVLPQRNAGYRSHSVDAITRQRHGYDPSTALILKHEGSGTTCTATTTTRMQHYIFPNSAAAGQLAAGASATSALLVQPISSATLASSANVLPTTTNLLNTTNVGDATAALVAAAGGSPVIASSTNSLYTFYPAEGNLQVWQSECGDLNYKSSRNLQPHKAPVCWTQSIPRQTRRRISDETTEKKLREFRAFTKSEFFPFLVSTVPSMCGWTETMSAQATSVISARYFDKRLFIIAKFALTPRLLSIIPRQDWVPEIVCFWICSATGGLAQRKVEACVSFN
uniref:Uncharacterized protein n=1 Tax=Glossina palpalis gambiensis TaxID=67801 RepID=A0A1B0BFB1_9MUSC